MNTNGRKRRNAAAMVDDFRAQLTLLSHSGPTREPVVITYENNADNAIS